MGHLGQGTPITTVQDKEIVLTASDGKYFKMKITDLAEAVRAVMPVATASGKGLLSDVFHRSVFNSPVTNSYIGNGSQLPTSSVDGTASKMPLGAFYIIPTPDCSLYGKGDGMIVTLRRSFITAQIYFSRSGNVHFRTTMDYNDFNHWRQISFT